MADCCQDGIACNPNDLRQALSVHTRKITDSCRDKDCIEDLRVYLTQGSQSILDSSASAKVRCADLLYTYIDVEPVAFDRTTTALMSRSSTGSWRMPPSAQTGP